MADVNKICGGRPRRAAVRMVAAGVVAVLAAASLSAAAAAEGAEGAAVQSAATGGAFTDVGGVHEANIEALAGLGVLDGTECGELQFCPGKPAARWAVAVWIVRVIDGPVPPGVSESRFADVDDDEWWMPYVERLADLGVTAGCRTNPLRFCPNGTVTRAEMASFLVRAFDLPNAGPAGFVDTAGSAHEATIDALYAAGVTAGCSATPLRYCPNSPVSRAEMASLLNSGRIANARTGPFPLQSGPRSGDTLISATVGRTCAVRAGGTVACWGGDEADLAHLAASGLDDVVALSAGDAGSVTPHTCVLHRSGRVSCWGPGDSGQLGHGGIAANHLPGRVLEIADAVAVSAGSGFTCAVHRRDGGVSCWGSNRLGQLGDGEQGTDRLQPHRVPRLSDVTAIASGDHHSCAVHRDGALSCWGWIYHDEAVGVTTPGDVSSVSIGGAQTCIVTDDGQVWCWHHLAIRPSQMTRIGVDDAVKVAVSDDMACALRGDGTVWCWGDNRSGRLGDGTTVTRTAPAAVRGLRAAVDVAVSPGSSRVAPHACAMHRDGSVSCWGGNELGQLADGTRLGGHTPRRAAVPDAVAASERPGDPDELLLAWMDAVVASHEGDFGWLRVAWDHIRSAAGALEAGDPGDVLAVCTADPAEPSVTCEVAQMTVSELSLSNVIHHLARVYDLHTGLAPAAPWGAVQLYFASNYSHCPAEADFAGVSILADTVLHLTVPHARLRYYEPGGCFNLPVEPTPEAERIVLAGLAGQVPDWYRDNITDSFELWTTWRLGPSLPAFANLMDQFGGLCTTEWLTVPLDPVLMPSRHVDPFTGCPPGPN